MISPTSARYYLPAAGLLRISGADRIDFIQRQSTNDLKQLTGGRHVSTVLTNPAARIVDVLQVFAAGEESLAAITLPGRGPATALFLKKRVFFNDKVSVTDETGTVQVLDLLGPAGQLDLPAGIRPGDPATTSTASFQGATIHTLHGSGRGEPPIRLVVPGPVCGAFVAALEEAGATAMPQAEYETLRVEAGLPGPAVELTEDYTPLETGLADLVSDTKGCYTGQEVIARQITYDKVTKHLAGIRLDGPAAAGDRVLAGDANAGTITSYVNSPREGYLALAVLKRPHSEIGTVVRVEARDGEVGGQVVDLPFVGESG